MTLSIMALRLTALIITKSTMTLSIMTFERGDTQLNELNCDTQHERNSSCSVKRSVAFFILMLSVVSRNAVLLNVVAPFCKPLFANALTYGQNIH